MSKTTYLAYDERLELRDIILNNEELKNHAEELGKIHRVSEKPKPIRPLLARLDSNYGIISSIYQKFNKEDSNQKELLPAVEWLLDNFYKIEEQVKVIRQELAREKFLKLYSLSSGYLKGYPRAYAIALDLISHTDGRLDEESLIEFVKSYQIYTVLSIAEIWSLSLMVRTALIEIIRNVCEKIDLTQLQLEKVERLQEENQGQLLSSLKNELDKMGKINTTYIEYFLRRLRKKGIESGEIIDYIEKKLIEYDVTLNKVIEIEHREQANKKVSIGNAITSLNRISTIDWNDIFEKLSVVEDILREDPAKIYIEMDFDSRDYYRHMIEKISKKCGIQETKIARKAIECCESFEDGEDDLRLRHVGYYIIDEGRKELLRNLDCNTPNIYLHNYPLSNYLAPIIILTGVLSFIVAFYSYGLSGFLWTSILAGLITLLPLSDVSVKLVNWLATKIVSPSFIPKLEYREGITEDASTIVVIPTLLPSVKTVYELIRKLEVYYLGNREKNLYFALAGDFKDSENKIQKSDKTIVDEALRCIRELNKKYSDKQDIFYYFHRRRQYSKSQEKWMGWERKRGALVEFNELIMGSKDTTYNVISGNIEKLNNIRYVITLDADTNLPLDTAKKLVGAISHPLNRARYDEGKRLVTSGFGLIQPRIGIDIESANTSRFTRIFAGQGGIDPYTTASSDVYQDLFSEGSFTGKGIYDVRLFNRVLRDEVPDNSILSHDLLEGSYIRAGLATDIELIDGYPSKYSSYIMRAHRWTRGDWQLLLWLSNNIINRIGEKTKNPLSPLSKWKIFDNLRRSILPIAELLTIILGLGVLPGNSFYWLAIVLFTMGFPILLEFINFLISKNYRTLRENINANIVYGIKQPLYQACILFAFLPHRAFMMLDAIIRTLYRVLVSKKNLLEWVTAADVERSLTNDIQSSIKRMRISIAVAVFTIVIGLYTDMINGFLAVPIGLLWMFSPIIAHNISQKIDEEKELNDEDRKILRRIARKTWAYYEDFAKEEDNYLPPDNFQEDPDNGVAHRTSPTNIGFLLISILSARDFGYISTIDLIEYLNKTLSTIERLETWKGHLFNWYNTQTLEVLRPLYVSTVDSGNYLGYLITLKEGLKELLNSKIIDINKNLRGIKDTFDLLEQKDEILSKLLESFTEEEMNLEKYSEILESLAAAEYGDGNWDKKFVRMIEGFRRDIDMFLVDKSTYRELLILAEKRPYSGIRHILETKETELEDMSLVELNCKYSTLAGIANKEKKAEDKDIDKVKEKLNILSNNSERYFETINSLIGRIEKLIDDMDFIPLYSNKMNLFSIGYDVLEEKMTNSYYDLLASEARLASFITIARKEIPMRHWFKLGRALSEINHYRALVSWTGTMFEYLMPPLIMKTYENTLLDETYSTVVKAQKIYGQKRKTPWGTSESGYYAFDMNLNYQYKAFGVPDLGLKRGLMKDMVISPYSTILALPYDSKGSIENIRRLIKDGVEGKYGFYEAIDYTPQRVPFNTNKAVIKSFMAHHQGMSFIALNNYLNMNIMQKRFHSDPMIESAKILLQERIPIRKIITKEYKEYIGPFKERSREPLKFEREFNDLGYPIPRCHILTNGRYSTIITDGGSGYSKREDLQITRWREDALVRRYGNYIFIKNLNSNKIWSTSYDPLDTTLNGYKVKFSLDKAEFIRTEDNIDSRTEIVVSTEDDVEIRKITLTNHSEEEVLIELTSYLEIVLANQAADIAHPAFSNLFIRTEIISQYDSLIASRRPRVEGKETIWMLHKVTIDGEKVGNLEYETNRGNFLGRSRNIWNPIALTNSLKNSTGPILDPIMSLRRSVKIEPGKSASLSYITGIAHDREKAIELSQKYNDLNSIERAFQLANVRSQVESTYLNLMKEELEIYQDMISQIIFLSPNRRKSSDIISQNVKGQSSLWAYGISGDLPIILVSVRNADEMEIVKEALKAHEYMKLKGLSVDLVILNEDESNYYQPLQELLKEIVFTIYGNHILDRPGGVFIRNASIMPREDIILLYTVARIILKGDKGTIKAQIRITDIEDNIPELKKFSDENITYIDKDEDLDLDFFNGYGGYSKDGLEYIITLKGGLNTPAPWINVISNGDFGFNITENGSGFTWAENSRENKLSPWSNDPVSDPPGEIIYIRDEISGRLWSITPLPIREKESYIIRHGIGYSSFKHCSNGIEQRLTLFSPKEESVKINMVKLKNSSTGKRKLSIIYYIKPNLGTSEQFTQQYIKTEFDSETGYLAFKNLYNSDFPDRIAFLSSTEKIVSYTGDREEFIGRNNLSNPEALRRQRFSNNVGIGFDPCGAVQINMTLEPNQEKSFAFMFGHSKEIDEVRDIVKKYRSVKKCDRALVEVKEYWQGVLGSIKVKTPELSMDLLLNQWLMYQTIACRIWARSAFYQSGGAYGFRDQLQDVMNSIYVMPEATKDQILLHCAHQFVEGDVQHWWHPGAGEKGIRTRFSDDLLWLPFVTAEYIKHTGDSDILNEVVHYLEDEPLGEHEDERYGIPRISEEKGTVYEHCVRAIDISLRYGEHGIPLMGSGDWNDGMSTVGNKGKGESIWLGWFIYYTLMKFIDICSEIKDFDREKRYRESAKGISRNIDKNAWDGAWYRRAYFDDGTPLGSIENTECMIDSLAQSWAVISKAGDESKIEKAMDSVEKYLIKRDEGLILLFTPPFDNSDLHPGYIKGYVPGVRENGGQYTHAATWVIKAFAEMGDGNKATELFNMINPINHSRTSIESNTYKVEPYVAAADVYAVSPHIGRGGWTWYTGTSGWMYRVGLESILGFKKERDKLFIDPCIPREWKEYKIEYKYKKATYRIKVTNPDAVNRNVKTLLIDGEKTGDKYIPLVDKEQEYYVEVVLGKDC
ncbi:glucoamylase family protein [Wukongibacter sp. M2B1]